MQTHEALARTATTDPDEWLTKKQIADRWKVSERTVERVIRNGTLKVVKVGLGRKLVRARARWADEALEASIKPVES